MKSTIQEFLVKVYSGQVKVLDDDLMIIDHCISDNLPDRVGDDLPLEGWETDNFMMNPVVLDIHEYSKPPVGKSLGIYYTGNQMRAKTQFAPTEEGKKYYSLYKGGFMAAFSVGFIPLEYTPNETGGYHIPKKELLEYSVVPVPANPRALKSFLEEKDDKGFIPGKNLAVPANILYANEIVKSGAFEHEGITYHITEKAGAKISKKNRDKLSQAHGLIKEVLEDAEALEDDSEGKGVKIDDIIKILKGESEE